MMSAGVLLSLLLGTVLTLGWIVLLTIGIVNLGRGAKRTGAVLTIIGGLWGLGVVVTFAVAMVIGFRTVQKTQSTSFDSASYKGKMGRIVTPYHGDSSLTLEDLDTLKRIDISSKDGVFSVPAAKYWGVIYEITSTGVRNSSTWTARCTFGGSGARVIEVEEGKDARFDAGPPFTASVLVGREANGSASLYLDVVDSEGRKYSVMPPGGQPIRFAVTNEAGKTLWTGSFRYG